jgi:uncharacterized protein
MSEFSFKIKEIPDEGRVVSTALPQGLLDEAYADLEVDRARTDGSVELTLHKTGEEVLVRGRLKLRLGLSCDACLGPAELEAGGPFQILFRPEGDAPAGDEEDPLDEQEIETHDRVTVELAPLLREQLILAVPMSVRCREDCRGLCPTCGADLNQGACGCASEAARSAFGARLAAALGKPDKDKH